MKLKCETIVKEYKQAKKEVEASLATGIENEPENNQAKESNASASIAASTEEKVNGNLLKSQETEKRGIEIKKLKKMSKRAKKLLEVLS